MFVTTFYLIMLKSNGDEDTNIQALPASVNFRGLVKVIISARGACVPINIYKVGRCSNLFKWIY